MKGAERLRQYCSQGKEEEQGGASEVRRWAGVCSGGEKGAPHTQLKQGGLLPPRASELGSGGRVALGWAKGRPWRLARALHPCCPLAARRKQAGPAARLCRADGRCHAKRPLVHGCSPSCRSRRHAWPWSAWTRGSLQVGCRPQQGRLSGCAVAICAKRDGKARCTAWSAAPVMKKPAE